MAHECFDSPCWWRAATLNERAFGIGTTHEGEGATETALQRFAHWQSQVPFNAGDYLRKRLALAGLNEDKFLHILGEPIEAVQGRLPAPWLRDIEEAFIGDSSGADSIPLPTLLANQVHRSFLRPLEPLVHLAHRRLRAELEKLAREYPNPPFNQNMVADLLLPQLARQFEEMVNRTFVLELNVARMEEKLSGRTPEERFESFLELISQRDRTLCLLSEYPVLARLLVLSVDRWLTTSVEFLFHLCADWPAIKGAFHCNADPGILVELSDGVGDSHRGGRSVRIARFADEFRVVYKPRTLTADVHFQELLGWLNDRGVQPQFRLLSILDMGDHGWQEFVTRKSCTTVEAVSRFYERQGAYLALLYILAGTDFHCENLIAAGEDPVLIDLETVFHPQLAKPDLREAEQIALKQLFVSSVLGAGLLPQRVFGDDKRSEGLDVSGMGGMGGQLSPFDSLWVEDNRTDQMHFIRKRLTTEGSDNLPTLNGSETSLLDYERPLVDGFARTYQLLLAHRDELLSESGPLLRFGKDEVRVVLRPTRTYSLLLNESFHPDVLHDALDRDRLLDRLWLAAQEDLRLQTTIAAEQKDLLKGDIPIFTTQPDSCDLWDAGHERRPEYFQQAAITQLQYTQLDGEDLARQIWLIGASVATVSGAPLRVQPKTANSTTKPTDGSREHLLAAARAVGDRLTSLAIKGNGNVSWIGLSCIEERGCGLKPVGADLYEGLSGIALFLGYLGEIARDHCYTELARTAVSSLQLERAKSIDQSTIGGFSGWGGVVYALAHLASLLNDSRLLDKAEEVVALLPALIERDLELDFVGGSAGCIAGLLSLHRVRASTRTLGVALQCGERLLTRARQMDCGIGWPVKAALQPLGGVSHGASGFSLALLSLFEATGDPQFRTAARQAIEYERTLFCKEVGNWVDMRQPSSVSRRDRARSIEFGTSWCNGASGIGLARLMALPYMKGDQLVYEEIRAALNVTLSQGFGQNHSLCHGDLGSLELLLATNKHLKETDWTRELETATAKSLESISRDGWICGVPLGIEVPGLMTGLAGIGYELLRLAEPERVPSVLCLEPPVVSSDRPICARRFD